MKRKVNIRKIVDEYLKQDRKKSKLDEKQKKLIIDLIKEVIVFALVLWVLLHNDEATQKKKLDDEYLLKFQYHIQEEEE